MQRNLSDLVDECKVRGIELLFPPKTYGKRGLIQLLAEYSIQKLGGRDKLSWGMRQRLKIESPMLCFAFKNLKPKEREDCMVSGDWIAERKLDGCRMIMTYHPDEGFVFFSRNISVENFLPVDYSDKILVQRVGQGLNQGSRYKKTLSLPFVLDTEVLCDAENIDTTIYRGKQGTVTGTALNAATSILSIEIIDSHRIQREQAPLRIVVFDILQAGEGDLMDGPLVGRLIARYRIVRAMQQMGFQITEVDSVDDDRQEFYDHIVAEGGEGIVLKNLNSPYIATTSRRRTGFVKRKRSMEEAAGGDIDAFITGFVPSNPKKSWAHLIGALEMSVQLLGPPNESGDRTIEERVIASVASMPLKLREEMTTVGTDGIPRLKQEYFCKVLVINGQDMSPKSKRFMHATIDWKRGFREDKSHLDCEMEAEFLESQIL